MLSINFSFFSLLHFYGTFNIVMHFAIYEIITIVSPRKGFLITSVLVMLLQTFPNIVGNTNKEGAPCRICCNLNIIYMLLHSLIKYNPTICHFDHFDYSQCRLREKSLLFIDLSHMFEMTNEDDAIVSN